VTPATVSDLRSTHFAAGALILALSPLVDAIPTCTVEAIPTHPRGARAESSSASITVAAAADLQPILPEIAERFRQATGHRVQLIFGSSGNFFSQIQNGAPFDLFFSADIDYPRRLEAAGLAAAGTLQPYAVGRIVLWAAAGTPVDISRGLEILIDPRIRRIAIANPEHAPYGRAAVEALRSASLYDRVRDRLVLGENVAQAAQFVQSGAADAGIIAWSQALAPGLKDRGVFHEIPASLYHPIEQAAVVLESSVHRDLSTQFLSFLERAEIQRLLRSHGFSPPSRHHPER
jgi:molybdate transport system substrate-binding protein